MDSLNFKIQIFGERCSGTNYLEQLLAKNFPSLQIGWDFGWKHFFHKKGVEHASDHLFVILYRNPFDWVKSFQKHPWHTAHHLRGIPISEFIRQEWQCIWDEDAFKTPDDPIYGTEMACERCPVTGNRFANVLKMRSAKIRDWESLREKVTRSIYVRYEDLRNEPDTFIDNVSNLFCVESAQKFINIDTYKGMGGKYRPSAYNPLTRDDIQFIIQELDEPLELSIGYNLRKLAEDQTVTPPQV